MERIVYILLDECSQLSEGKGKVELQFFVIQKHPRLLQLMHPFHDIRLLLIPNSFPQNMSILVRKANEHGHFLIPLQNLLILLCNKLEIIRIQQLNPLKHL